MRVPRRWAVFPLVFVATALLVTGLVNSSRKHSILAARTNLMLASKRYPKFTLAQHMAIMHELQSEKHPLWRDLSMADLARRLVALAMPSSDASQPPNAPFSGNLTTISVPGGDAVGMERAANCSLTEGGVSYSINLPSVSYTSIGTTPNYDQVLHNKAGLTTTGGHWPAGCGDPIVGLSSRTWALLGYTASGNSIAAAIGYDPLEDATVIWNSSGNPGQGATLSVNAIGLGSAVPVGASSGNLTGNGIQDLVVVSSSGTTGGTASVSVLLANADGSLQTPVSYALPGDTGISVVIDDFNGDGIPDLVASSSSFSTGTTTYSLSFFAGKGDGTFQAPQNYTVTPPSGFNSEVGVVPYYGLMSADLRGNGNKDLVTGGGIVLLGNGDGTFNQSSTLAFPTLPASSAWGPNVVAADFNKDGKIDLAVDNGESIWTYLGNGDGTFNPSYGYATIDNVGYLYATDLDGDGNTDLYSGVASGGMFEGDKFDHGESYALMGNGNGAFQGAPELPFVFTGTNMADLTGNGVLDGVGVNASLNSNVSFTSYLGNGDGTFKTGPSLQVSPITVQGTPVSFGNLDSFGLGSTRGNGIADLVYLPAGFTWPGGTSGFFLATGNGDGSFNAPVFVPAPTFAPSGDFDDYETLSNLFVTDVNGDGKADLIYSYSVAVYQTNTYEQGIAVQLSNGDGTFQAPQVIQTYSSTTAPVNAPPGVVQLGDATGSGKLDLFTESGALDPSTDMYAYSLQLYLGNGDGTFGSALTPPVADNFNVPLEGQSLGQIVIADMNGDGKPDLVTLGTDSNGDSELAISLGNGDGTYQTPTKLDFAGGETVGYGLAVADFNGDGKKDVAVTGFDPPYDTGIFLGNGDGTVQIFTPSGGTAQPSEAINLLVFGPALPVNLNGGTGLPGLIAGGAVLVNQASTTPTLTPTTTTLSASASNITPGQDVTFTATVTSSSTPSGSVTFYDGATPLATATLNGSGVAIYSTSALALGSHSITASYAGNSTFAGSTSSAATVNVATLIATTTKLTASATTVNAGASVTFNATVAPASGSGTPTGTVTFMDGTTTLAMASLSGGAASYSTSGLSVGSHSITAVYGGDSNDSGSTSNTVMVTVQALVPSFTLGALPTSGSVAAGSSAQTTVTVTPVNGFNSQVSFACSGASNGVSCSFNPATVTPNGTAAASTMLTIATTSQSAALASGKRGSPLRGARGAAALAFLATGALWFFRRHRSSSWSVPLLMVSFLLLTAVATISCGGGSLSSGSGGTGGTGSQSQNYTITITATAGSESQTAIYTLTVQ